MKILAFLLILAIPLTSFAGGRYEKKKVGECVGFDAVCLDIEAMATIASEYEKVVQQCRLDIQKQSELAQTVYDGMKLSFEVEVKKKDAIIEMLQRPSPPPKSRSIWPYIALGGGGIVVGAVTTLIIFLAK